MKARKSPKASEPTLRERVVQLEEDANSESAGPTGIVAQSLDGRLFFIPDTQAATFEIQPVYSRITDKIIADLEEEVRPWLKPWNADHAAGRITRPLRHNGVPYKGHQCRDAVVRCREQGLRLPALADLQAGAGARATRRRSRTR